MHIVENTQRENCVLEYIATILVYILLSTYIAIQSCCCLVVSCVQIFWDPMTVAHQDLLSMGFSRQEYWSGLPFSSPGDLLNPGIEPRSPALQQML